MLTPKEIEELRGLVGDCRISQNEYEGWFSDEQADYLLGCIRIREGARVEDGFVPTWQGETGTLYLHEAGLTDMYDALDRKGGHTLRVMARELAEAFAAREDAESKDDGDFGQKHEVAHVRRYTFTELIQPG
jgi:hypothetical protein